MDFRVTGQGSGEPVEPPQKKRGRQQPEQAEPREARERKAKTDAVFKTRSQLKAEDAPIKEQKRSLEGVSPPVRKIRKGEGGHPHVSEEKGTGTFLVLGRDVVQKVLSFLPTKKDLQAARVEHFMDDQVVRKVKGNDISLINRLTECLRDNLSVLGLQDQLKMPEEIMQALDTKNLDDYQDALYAVRARVLDVLSQLDEETLNSLEKAFLNTTYKLPKKFENIFEMARVESVKGIDKIDLSRLEQLGEWHEVFRITIHQEPDLTAVSGRCSNLLDLKRFEQLRVGQVDGASLRQLLRFYESQPDSAEKNCGLAMVHMMTGVTTIFRGSYDKAIESFSKVIKLILGLNEKVKVMGDLVDSMADMMPLCEIDNKSAGKIFILLEEAVKTLPDSPEKDALLAKLHGVKLTLYALKGFAELQIAVNRALEFINNFPDQLGKVQAFSKIFDYIDFSGGEETVAIARFFNAIKAAKESDAKNATLVTIYHDCIEHPDRAPASIKGDLRLKALAALEKIQDPDIRQILHDRFISE